MPKYLNWVLLILLCCCTAGFIHQNRINALAQSLILEPDTTAVDTIPKLLTPEELADLLQRKSNPPKKTIAKSQIPFAEFFQLYAPEIGWEWELLAAVCYCESKFNPEVVSRSGAMGLMQLMPKPAAKFGLEDPFDPEQNIAAGTRYIDALLQIYSFIPSKKEKIKFVLASYNAGPAHIMDARRLAKQNGDNPDQWTGSVDYWLYLLKDSTVASSEVVKYGTFNAMQTLLYVPKVIRQYERYRNAPDVLPIDSTLIAEPDTIPIDSLLSADTTEVVHKSELDSVEEKFVEDFNSESTPSNEQE